MIIRSRAPLRLGLAGGGTDISSYCDVYGGCVLNATINLYAHATLIPLNNSQVVFINQDTLQKVELVAGKKQKIDGILDLQKGAYNYYLKNYPDSNLSLELTTSIDVPSGSGLGTSSALLVAIIGAYNKFLHLEMTNYEVAELACQIERVYLKQAGGKQDQYAATFGGFNFMEFDKDNVTVSPIRLQQKTRNELESTFVLYFTGTQRLSSKLIEEQKKNINSGNKKSLSALHEIKKQALEMKRSLVREELNEVGNVLNIGWMHKKKTSPSVSNGIIDHIYTTALEHGALGGKITGAGGGGFMFFYCPGTSKKMVISELNKLGGEIFRFNFTDSGLESWSIK